MSDDAPTETEAAYRKRAKTAPLVFVEGPWKQTIIEAVYWPGVGYGISLEHETRDQAEAAVRRTMMLGYGMRQDKSRIHIIEIRTRIIEVTTSAAEAKERRA